MNSTNVSSAAHRSKDAWHWPTARITFILTWVFVMILLAMPFTDTAQYKKLLNEKAACEAQLPRNQECSIKVVPPVPS
jgi:preprotein translocase subunit SecG